MFKYPFILGSFMHNGLICYISNKIFKWVYLGNTILLTSTLSMSIKCLCLWNEFLFYFYYTYCQNLRLFVPFLCWYSCFTIIFWYSLNFHLFSSYISWYLFLPYSLFMFFSSIADSLYFFLAYSRSLFCYVHSILLLDLILFLYFFDNKQF